MRRILLVACAGLLGACTYSPGNATHAKPATAAQQADLVNSIRQLTVQDLTTAIQIANVPQPPDIEAIQCATYLQQYVGGAQGSAPAFIAPTGAASAFETVRVGVMRLENGGLAPTEKVALEMACGPLALSVAYQVAQGLIDYASIGPIGGVLKALVPVLGAGVNVVLHAP